MRVLVVVEGIETCLTLAPRAGRHGCGKDSHLYETALHEQIKAMGISLLIAESNVTNATRVADRLYAIDRGEVIFEGRPQDVLQRPEVMQIIRG